MSADVRARDAGTAVAARREGFEPTASTGISGRADLSRVALASISRRGQDGVSYVARLLERAIADIAGGPPATVDLEPQRPGRVSAWERLSFVARAASVQRPGGARHLLYGHVGIARAQALVPRPLRRSYGVFLHGVEVWQQRLGDDQQRVLAEAAILVSNSHFTARRVMELYPAVGAVKACPLALLEDEPPNGDDVDHALLARIAPRSALIVGRLSASERYKGHDALLEAWPAVRAMVPDAQLVVAGRGEDAERLRAKAQEAGVGECVIFCGGVSDGTLAALYERAALFAMPSRGEGFGIVYLEAMRAGLACVASHQDGAVDVVQHARTGLLVSPEDRAAVALAVGGLLADPARARALGEAGRARYLREFTFPHFRERLRDILACGFASDAGPRR